MSLNRHRVSDEVSLTSRPDTRTLSYYQGSTTSTVVNRSPVGTYRVCDDVVTKRYQAVRDAGGIVNNPYTSYKSIVSAADKAFELTKSNPQPGDWYKESHSAGSGVVNNPPVGSFSQPGTRLNVTALEQLAITAAYSKVGAPDIQTLVSLAEAKQTLALLATPYRALRAVLSRSPGGPKGFWSKTEKMSEWWLTYRYGVIPLLMDIQGILKVLSRAVDGRERATARAVEKDTTTYTYPSNYQDNRWILNATATVSEQLQVSGGVLYEAQLELADRLGMTTLNIASSAWELVPWSFVIDWLLNVGDVIQALEASARSKTLCAWTASRHFIQINYIVTVSTVTSTAAASGWSVTKSCVGATAVGDYTRKTRVPRTISDIGLVAKLKLTPKRIADAVALGRTNLRVK